MAKILSALIPKASRPDRVGPRITALREALPMQKGEFADSIELDRSTLTKIEKGDAGLDIAMGIKITTHYGVGLDFIYRGDLTDVPAAIRPRLMVELATYGATGPNT